jgi:hypothetical protein
VLRVSLKLASNILPQPFHNSPKPIRDFAPLCVFTASYNMSPRRPNLRNTFLPVPTKNEAIKRSIPCAVADPSVVCADPDEIGPVPRNNRAALPSRRLRTAF